MSDDNGQWILISEHNFNLFLFCLVFSEEICYLYCIIMLKPNLSILKRVISLSLAIIFAFSGVAYPADLSTLPAAGTLLMASPRFEPVTIKGLKIYPNDPLRLDFILDQSDTADHGTVLREKGRQLIRYFLACLTVPAKDLWVNLSPYEPERISPNEFGLTEMGQELLAQDYILKQLAASLTYPETDAGKKYWNEVNNSNRSLSEPHPSIRSANGRNTQGAACIETTQSFTKVWIVPDKAVVCEENNTAMVKEAHLKVLMEEDYLAVQKNVGATRRVARNQDDDRGARASHRLAPTQNNDAFKTHILPLIEKEVNEGANFAQLRQAYHSLILAVWFKKKMRATFFNQCYLDQKKIAGVKGDDPTLKEKLYQKYLEAFQKGAYNYIKRDRAGPNKITKRAYFSGGANLAGTETIETVVPGIKSARATLTDPSTLAVALSPAGQKGPKSPIAYSKSLKTKGKFHADQSEKIIGGETLIINPQTPADTARLAKKLLAARDKRGQPLAEQFNIPIEHEGKTIDFTIVVDRELSVDENILKEFITNSVEMTEGNLSEMPRQIVITSLDRSPHLAENHHRTGIIGINRAVGEIRHPEISSIIRTMLVYHEFAHKVTGRYDDDFEAEQTTRDLSYLSRRRMAYGIRYPDFVHALEEISESIDAGDFLKKLKTAAGQDNGPIRIISVTSGSAEELLKALFGIQPKPPADPANTYRTKDIFYSPNIVMTVNGLPETLRFTGERDVARFMRRLPSRSLHTFSVTLPQQNRPKRIIDITTGDPLILDRNGIDKLITELAKGLGVSNLDNLPDRLNIVFVDRSEHLVDCRFARYGFIAVNYGMLKINDQQVFDAMILTLIARGISSAITARDDKAFREAQIIRDAQFALETSARFEISLSRWHQALDQHRAFDIGTLITEIEHEAEVYHAAAQTARMNIHNEQDNIVDTAAITLPSGKKYNLFLIGHSHAVPQISGYIGRYLINNIPDKKDGPNSPARRLYRTRLENIQPVIAPQVKNYRHDIAAIREITKQHSLAWLSIEASPSELKYSLDSAKKDLQRLKDAALESGIPNPLTVAEELILYVYGPEIYMSIVEHDPEITLKIIFPAEDDDTKSQGADHVAMTDLCTSLLAHEIEAHGEDPSLIKDILSAIDINGIDETKIDRLTAGCHEHVIYYARAMTKAYREFYANVSMRSAVMAKNIVSRAASNTKTGDTFIHISGMNHNGDILEAFRSMAEKGKVLAGVKITTDPKRAGRNGKLPVKPAHSESLKPLGDFYAERSEKLLATTTTFINPQTPEDTAGIARLLLVSTDAHGEPLAEALPITAGNNDKKAALSVVVDREFALTQEGLEAHITEVAAETNTDIGKLPHQIVITYLDRSRRLAQAQHGTIGINRAVQAIKNEKVRKIFQNMLLRHELAHVLTGRHSDDVDFETEQDARDRSYLISRLLAADINGQEFRSALDDASGSIDSKDFLEEGTKAAMAQVLEGIARSLGGNVTIVDPSTIPGLTEALAAALSDNQPEPPVDYSATYRVKGDFASAKIVMQAGHRDEIVRFNSEAEVTAFMRRLGPEDLYTLPVTISLPGREPRQISITLSKTLGLNINNLQAGVTSLIENLGISDIDRIPRQLNIVFAQKSEYLVDCRFAEYGFIAVNPTLFLIPDLRLSVAMASTIVAHGLSACLTGKNGPEFKAAQIVRDALHAARISGQLELNEDDWRQMFTNNPAFDVDTLMDEMEREAYLAKTKINAALIAEHALNDNRVDAVTLTLPSRREYKLFILGHRHNNPKVFHYINQYLLDDTHTGDPNLQSMGRRKYRARLEGIYHSIAPQVENYRRDIATIRQIAQNHHLISVGIEASQSELEHAHAHAAERLETLKKLAQESGIPHPETVADDIFLYMYGPELYLFLTDQSPDPVIKRVFSAEDDQLKDQNVDDMHLAAQYEEQLKHETAKHEGNPALAEEIIKLTEHPNIDEARIHRLTAGCHPHVINTAQGLLDAKRNFFAGAAKRSAIMAKKIANYARNNTLPGDTLILPVGENHNPQILEALGTLAARGEQLIKVEPIPGYAGGRNDSGPTAPILTVTIRQIGVKKEGAPATPGGVNFDAEKINLEIQTKWNKDSVLQTQAPFDLKGFEGFTFREISLKQGAEI